MSPRTFRTYHEIEDGDSSGLEDQVVEQRTRLRARLDPIGAVVAVVSGKGGVGKSAVTANLAVHLARRGASVGAVDGDLNGPSLGRMLGVSGAQLVDRPEGVEPPAGAGGVRVMTMELLQGADDAPLSWKGPGVDTFIWESVAETGALREFLADVSWGELDYLLVDLPPGTGKIRRLLELIPSLDQVLVVTTPSSVAGAVVARSVTLLREAGVRELGLVANMTEFHPPGGGDPVRLFPGDGVRMLAGERGMSIWAEIPFDPELGARTDAGMPLSASESAATRAFEGLARRVESAAGGRHEVSGGSREAP